MNRRTTFVSRSRQMAGAEIDARKAWLLLLGDALRLGERVSGGGAVDRFEGPLFAGQVVRLKAKFPPPHVTAQAAAAAFLLLAKGFVESGFTPALAGFLAAGARTLTEMIDAETRAAFQRSCAAVGDD